MPWRFAKPAKKPRTACGAQVITAPICATVAASGLRSIASTCACLVASRGGFIYDRCQAWAAVSLQSQI
jgi:hypothetical protein